MWRSRSIEPVQLLYRRWRYAPGLRSRQPQAGQRTHFQHSFPHSPVTGCTKYASPAVCRALLKPTHTLCLHECLYIVQSERGELSVTHESHDFMHMIDIAFSRVWPDIRPRKIGGQNLTDSVPRNVGSCPASSSGQKLFFFLSQFSLNPLEVFGFFFRSKGARPVFSRNGVTPLQTPWFALPREMLQHEMSPF